MAIEVRIPTILRTYTDGAKQVEGTGCHARRADRSTWSSGTAACATA